jgi:hypothetical protein
MYFEAGTNRYKKSIETHILSY